MVRRPLLPLLVVVALACVACSGDDDDSAEAPAGTVGTAARETTTTTDPELTVEEEVEAAYLRSWDVYAEAALALDPSGLDELYADRALEIVIADIATWTEAGTPARFEVEHDYEISVDGDTAEVRDSYVNHSVLLDGETRQPIEDDPNEVVSQTYELERLDGTWKVTGIFRD